MDRKKLFNTLALIIVVIFLANAIANKFYWYSSVWYFDIIMHFFGGFWLGILALYFFRPQALSLRFILRALALVLLVGVGWEIFEAFMDKTVSQNPLNILDTTSDIFFDAAGGAIAVFYYMRKIMRVAPDKVQ